MSEIDANIPIFSAQNAPKSEIFGHKPGENEQKEAKDEQNSPKFTDLETIEVGGELAFLYTKARRLLEIVLVDDQTPANQKSQVMNSALAMIERISKTRTDLYSAERMRKLEQTIIKTLRDFPRELQEQFLEAYERNLRS